MHLNCVSITKSQMEVLAAIAAGRTITASAKQAGVHRNTVNNWRLSSGAFRQVCEKLDYERAVPWRDAMEKIAAAALEELRFTMVDHNSPPIVRVRAALSIINAAVTVSPLPPHFKPEHQSSLTHTNVIAMPNPASGRQLADFKTQTNADRTNAKNGKFAQSCTTPASQPHSKPPCPACSSLPFGVPDLQNRPLPVRLR